MNGLNYHWQKPYLQPLVHHQATIHTSERSKIMIYVTKRNSIAVFTAYEPDTPFLQLTLAKLSLSK